MSRLMLHATAFAGIVLALGATAANAHERHCGCARIAHVRHAGWTHRYPGFDVADTSDTFRPRFVADAPVRDYGYDTSGNGFGSTGYGYGGDFSAAYAVGTPYTSGYDDNQVLGYATRTGVYGGQPYGSAPPMIVSGRNYGYSGVGYGGGNGFSPAIPPAGGLAVYSPGAYGPGPRIITIPSNYLPRG